MTKTDSNESKASSLSGLIKTCVKWSNANNLTAEKHLKYFATFCIHHSTHQWHILYAHLMVSFVCVCMETSAYATYSFIEYAQRGERTGGVGYETIAFLRCDHGSVWFIARDAKVYRRRSDISKKYALFFLIYIPIYSIYQCFQHIFSFDHFRSLKRISK